MKNRKATKDSNDSTSGNGGAKFPYTNKPGSLRKLLTEIPKKPKPQKFDAQLLRSWGFTDSNDYSMIRVLKALGLLNSSNEPTEMYVQFMALDGGPAALAGPIKQVFAPLFTASHTPHKESPDKLKNLFHIHSGGGDRALQLQIQSFKALADSADFEKAAKAGAIQTGNGKTEKGLAGNGASSAENGAAVQINVHIHLPPNKSKSDYQSIIEDIGRYIFRYDPAAQNRENE